MSVSFAPGWVVVVGPAVVVVVARVVVALVVEAVPGRSVVVVVSADWPQAATSRANAPRMCRAQCVLMS